MQLRSHLLAGARAGQIFKLLVNPVNELLNISLLKTQSLGWEAQFPGILLRGCGNQQKVLHRY